MLNALQEYTKAVENVSEDNLFKVFQMKYAYALTVSHHIIFTILTLFPMISLCPMAYNIKLEMSMV